jgi:hypothetical protein
LFVDVCLLLEYPKMALNYSMHASKSFNNKNKIPTNHVEVVP